MSDTSLIFNLIAIDKATGILGKVQKGFGGFALGVGIAAVEAGTKFVGMAADFQTGITRLQTGAGESAANLGMVSNGILAMAGQVGESTKDLNAGMYLVESAGYHGAAGLNVLRDAAEGARVGNADMATVADAVTTALNAYHMGANGAAEATNALIAAEGAGKTNLEALSGSLSTVAPIAAVAHVSLNEVLGAMATMTAQGTPAADAATYLKQTIGQLSNPTAKARAEMKALGLDATQVSMNLGKNGLAATLNELTSAITAHMGPAGTVLIEQLSKASKNTTQFQQILANLPPTQQTYIGALATMVGGTKSMQAALELTGQNMQVFKQNTAAINAKVKEGGSTIENWSTVQKTFNVRLAEAKGSAEALGIKIGNALMPAAQAALGWAMSSVTWLGKHKDVAEGLAITIGTLAGAVLLYKTYVMASNAVTVVWTTLTKVGAAAQWLLNVALDANPIGLIVIAVAALTAGFIILWKNSEGFRNFWITFGDALLGVWDHVVMGIKAGIGGIVTGFKWLINGIVDQINGFTGGINTVIDLADKVPGVHIPDIPKIPHMASGGIVRARSGGTLALLGEGGQDEAVVPLGRGGAGGGRGGEIRLVVEAGAGDEKITALIVYLIQRYVRVTAGTGPNAVQVALSGRVS